MSDECALIQIWMLGMLQNEHHALQSETNTRLSRFILRFLAGVSNNQIYAW